MRSRQGSGGLSCESEKERKVNDISLFVSLPLCLSLSFLSFLSLEFSFFLKNDCEKPEREQESKNLCFFTNRWRR